jgi:MFS family permease
VGYLAAALFLGKLMGDPLWGLLRDKLGDKKTIIICTVLNFTFTILLSKSTTLLQLILVMCFSGLVSGVFIAGSGFTGWIETPNRDYLNMWIYISATAGGLLGPFTGAYLFDHVGEPKIAWTWIPVGSAFLVQGIIFIFAFRDFDDSQLIEESNYSKLEDSDEELEEIDQMNSMSLSAANDEESKIKQFDPASPNVIIQKRKNSKLQDLNSSFDFVNK